MPNLISITATLIAIFILMLGIWIKKAPNLKSIEGFLEAALKDQKRRDRGKREALKAAGYTLVEVPHTWDGSEKSLMGLIVSASI